MARNNDSKQRVMNAALELIWANSYGTISVDAICEKAGVKKGSFYYFFQSKSELAVEALEADWQSKKPVFDGLFSPAAAPLERLWGYFDFVVKRQTQLKEERGLVLGCPLFCIGCEIGTQDQAIGGKVREILDRYVKYFESAIRDAHAQGLIIAPDANAKAKALFALFQGTLTQARIQNSLEPFRQIRQATCDLLAVQGVAASAA